MSELNTVGISAWMFLYDEDADQRANREFNGSISVGPLSPAAKYAFGYDLNDVNGQAWVSIRDVDEPGVIEYSVQMALNEDGENIANYQSQWYRVGAGASVQSPGFALHDSGDGHQMGVTVHLKNHVFQAAT